MFMFTDKKTMNVSQHSRTFIIIMISSMNEIKFNYNLSSIKTARTHFIFRLFLTLELNFSTSSNFLITINKNDERMKNCLSLLILSTIESGMRMTRSIEK